MKILTTASCLLFLATVISCHDYNVEVSLDTPWGSIASEQDIHVVSLRLTVTRNFGNHEVVTLEVSASNPNNAAMVPSIVHLSNVNTADGRLEIKVPLDTGLHRLRVAIDGGHSIECYVTIDKRGKHTFRTMRQQVGYEYSLRKRYEETLGLTDG
jgi:hypothetical protein